MLDVSLFGLNPGKMHLVNLAIHIANTLLLFLVVLKIFKDYRIAAFSVLIFALNPLRIESVAWISQRKDLLSLFFGLSTCYFYINYLGSKRSLPYFTSLITFVLALLAKPSMITLPLLLILVEITIKLVSRDGSWKSTAWSLHKNKLPFALLSVVFGLQAIFSQSAGGGLRSLHEFSISDRLNLALPAYITYLGKLFWPFDLSIYHPVIQYPSALVLGCFISLLVISWACWSYRNQFPELIIAWLWFLISLFPMVGFVSIGFQAFADRWTQLAHIAPIIALVSISFRYFRKQSQIVLLAVTFALSWLSFNELKYWRSSETVFRRALEINPDNFMAHTNLGAALGESRTISDSEKLAEQTLHYEEAVRLNPTYPEALNNLGIVRAQAGRLSEAYRLFEKALRINPNLEVARINMSQVIADIKAQENK